MLLNGTCRSQLPTAGAAGTLVRMGVPEFELYKTLVELSRALAGQPDLETLCRSVADSLRRMVEFESLALVLHDPIRDRLRLHSVSAGRPYECGEVVVPTDGDHPGARVWREQKSLVLAVEDVTEAEGRGMQSAREHGIETLVLVPLSNGSRKLGLLVFGFTVRFTPEPEALCFLERVTTEVAVAVDGYLTRQALLHERDRIRALFQITNALVSRLPMEDLFAGISEQLNTVVAYDFAVVGLLNEATGEIHLRGLHSPTGLPDPEETSGSPEGLPAGEALATGQPVLASGREFERFPSPIFQRYVEVGLESICSIPLKGRNRTVGVLDISRRSAEQFTPEEVELLVQVANQIAIATENALAYHELSQLKDKLATEKLYLEDEIRFDQNVGTMVGEGPAFQAVLRGIQVVAPTDATVLIQGETGTGKELVARAIHDLSGRAKRSFIKVNCAAIPATLLESELFGHEKGSFTGAYAQKIGRFELAHQGTLFLDEIGEIPVELQSKLLRAIQEQELERLGGNRTIRVDVRFVAATNRNLKQMVDEGKFRSDLYYRLNVFPLNVPPLRERREDIPLLIRYFTQKHAKRMNRPIEEIPSSAIDALTGYDWPGNIRELQNVIERSVILSAGRLLQVALPDPVKPVAASRPSARADEAAERERILLALRESGGRVSGPSGAAEKLGLRRTTLQSRMKKLRIEHLYR